ncbi:unnamed protein product [Calicophoron daubneyi]|uniref:EF-hand domain-containing protein n=1 Tax=Calicophoron daubneyi TaxID=300641 RepID=A0AAV2TJQ2_CALDB
MAMEALQALLKDYNKDSSGYLNRTEWIRLCGDEEINMSSDLANQLFDGLDTDADGRVKISDILKDLQAYEANLAPPTPISSNRRSVSADPHDSHTYGSPTPTNLKSRNFFRDSRSEIRRSSRVKKTSQLLNGTPDIRVEDTSDDLFTTKKELAEDGSEVFSVTPVDVDPRYKNLVHLEHEISRSYPELLPAFHDVMDDFRSEVRANKEENSTLKQTYMKEKAERNNDMRRMEHEWDLQIQRIEERTKSELQQMVRDEYHALISNKEKEIADIRSQVDALKMKIQERELRKQTSITPDSTTDSGLWELDIPVDRSRSSSVSEQMDRSNLHDIVERLNDRETKLTKLKNLVANQEKQIIQDKKDLMNNEEERMELYSQLQRMREIMKRYAADEEDLYDQGIHTPFSGQSRAESILSGNDAETMRSPERIFKVILIGDTGVGKSSFMHQFCDGVFYPRLRATVGVDFRTRTLRVDNSAYSIQLWDTAGQEKYRSIVRTYFRKVDGVIIIYDVTMPDSFGNIRSWMEQISENSSDSKIPQVVVGNKIDLKNRPDVDVSTIVPTETGRKFAESLGAMFIETSACTAENVDEAVRMLAREMKLEEDTKIATVNVAATPTRKKSQTCCS